MSGTAQFHEIRLVLAREPEHPDGSRQIGYDLLAPLDEAGRLSPDLWRDNRECCRVRRFGEGEDRIGRLARRPGGTWYFDYDPNSSDDDQKGHRLGEESFTVGEYVSISDDRHRIRTYRVDFARPVVGEPMLRQHGIDPWRS